MKWRHPEPGIYESADGQYRVAKDTVFSGCEAAHPVSKGPGRRGSFCEGSTEHASTVWILEDVDTGELIGDGYDTARLAKAAAERHHDDQTLVSVD